MTTEAGEGAALSAERKWLDQIRMLAQQPNGPVTGRWPQRLGEAVAEIDRLRAALTASERERDIALGQLGKRIRSDHALMEERDASRAQLAAQQAENERLRAALREIGVWASEYEYGSALALAQIRDTARNALVAGGTEETSDGR